MTLQNSKRLNESLNNFKRVLMEREDFLGHGSWEYDLLSKNAVWSAGMYRLFGYDPAQDRLKVITNEDLSKLYLTKEDFEKANAHLNETLEKGGNHCTWSYEIKNHNGEIKVLESVGTIVRDSMGKGLKVLGTTRDVTLLKKYERELERKTSELNHLSKELEDSTYTACHDLQEPLRKISMLCEQLQNKYNGILPEDGKKGLEGIKLITKNARSLIDSLLEFSRITHQAQTFRKADLNVLLLEVKADLELKIEETRMTITSGTLPTLQVSSLQIKQLFSNILLNSIKFRRINVPPVIDIQSRLLEKSEIQNHKMNSAIPHFLITVQDNGIGFEETYATKIFQMFSRLHGKSEYPGTGIGLAFCKKIVENHKGHIFASSISDQGSVFSIILPEIQT